MRLALYTGSISPHQLPLAREFVARLGADNFRYIYTEQQGLSVERQKLGWGRVNENWLISVLDPSAQEWLENADALICSFRDIALIERRCKRSLRTYYTNERWFKPPIGRLRMLVPSFRRLITRMVSLCRQYDCFRMLPIGVHAYNDYKWAGVPESKMTLWGYFVEKGIGNREQGIGKDGQPLKVLWAGRMLKLKHVDTLIRAVAQAKKSLAKNYPSPSTFNTITLTLVGDGPEKERLIRKSQGMPNIYFRDPVPIEKVRELMREHDVFVFPSNGYEGWGAVVSEALEEGMQVIGSNQAGASATILPPTHRFDCGDNRRLAKLLVSASEGKLTRMAIGDWSVDVAANRLLREVDYAI